MDQADWAKFVRAIRTEKERIAVVAKELDSVAFVASHGAALLMLQAIENAATKMAGGHIHS